MNSKSIIHLKVKYKMNNIDKSMVKIELRNKFINSRKSNYFINPLIEQKFKNKILKIISL
tara:strand:+ start:994 stop:1173 length:180 start_codon:yes stop_codon:yes gene_type:complete